MADNEDRIVYPDEVEAVKEAAKPTDVQSGDSNSVEESMPTTGTIEIASRNVVVVPPNCPPGFVRGKDGVCRQVF